MFDLSKEWSVSFAGCGFMGIYYVGACSCILQRFPHLLLNARAVYGASAGALMAAVLAVGVPLEKCCADLMFMAKEARKHRLGPLHPSYNLLQIVKESLLERFPEDAHVRASGRLCVSLTRVSDGKNVLVSEFDSRDELIQVLVCSCFVPFYCGVIPPTYRGVRYVDGAASDNLPRCHLRNTVTFSAYAGESDICPRARALAVHEVTFNNVSIQVNAENVCRVTSTFFPPEPASMAEICQNGYVDALRFLEENNLISPDCLLTRLEAHTPACCEHVRASDQVPEPNQHWWLDVQLTDKLPLSLRTALCEACRDTRYAGGLLSQVGRVTSYLRLPGPQPLNSACSVTHRLVNWIPDAPADVGWFSEWVGDVYRKTWKHQDQDRNQERSLDWSQNQDQDRNQERSPDWSQNQDQDQDQDRNQERSPDWSQNQNQDQDRRPSLLSVDSEVVVSLLPSPPATPTSSLPATCLRHTEHPPLTPPPTPTFSPSAEASVSVLSSGLRRAMGWFRNKTEEENGDGETTE